MKSIIRSVLQSLAIVVLATTSAVGILTWRNAQDDLEANAGAYCALIGLFATLGWVYLWGFMKRPKK